MPYRIPLFAEIAKLVDLTVLYSAKRSDERDWTVDTYQLAYAYRILSGFYIKLPKPHYNEWRTIWFNPTLFFTLWRLKPDVVIGYEYSIPALTALLYSKLRGCAYITWSDMTEYAERELSRGQRFTRKLILPRSQAYIGSSYATCANFKRYGIEDDRIILAPLAPDFERFRAVTRSTTHPPMVLYVGYLNERKGVIHLLNAFKQVYEKLPESKLILVGTGDLWDTLQTFVIENQMQDAVSFRGFIESENLPEIYSQADVFVLPSLEDVFGVVGIEALASGLSVICSQYAGFSSHLTDGENAFIIDPFDHAALADRIIMLLTHPDLRDHLRAASESVLAMFTPEYSAAQFMKAIERVHHGKSV